MNIETAKAVQSMQNYIENNLDRELTVKDIACAGGYSQRHAMRIFKEFTGLSIQDYLREMRLTQAAKILKDKKSKIIDVALDFLFDSHEGFTKAFSKKFGISPKKYNNKPVPVTYFIPYPSLIRYYFKNGGCKKMQTNTSTVFIQVVERPKRKVIIKRGINAKEYFAYCDEVGCDIWGILLSVKEAMYEPAGFWLNKANIKAGTSEYVQGVEVPSDFNGSIPQGFEVIDLKPCKMMVFHGQPFNDEEFETAILSIQQSIKDFNPEIYGYNWSDDAPAFQLIPEGKRGYIEARPVKDI